MKVTEKKLNIKSILLITVILPILVIIISSVAIYVTAKSVQPQDTLDISLLDDTPKKIEVLPETEEEALSLTNELINSAIESEILKYKGSTQVNIDTLECENKNVEKILSFMSSSFNSKFMSFYEDTEIKYGEDASSLLSVLTKSTPDEFSANTSDGTMVLTLTYNKVFDNMYFLGDDTASVNMFIKENENVFSAINQKLIPVKCEYTLEADEKTGEIISLSISRTYDFSANIAFKNTLAGIGTTPLNLQLSFSENYSFSYAGIEIEEDIMTLDKNGYDTLTVTPFVEEGLSSDEYSLSFTAFDEHLTVDENGQIEAVKICDKPIAVKVTLEYLGKTFSDTCMVYVVNAVEKVKISETELSLKQGETHTLTAQISPDDATIKTVDFISSDESIVKVSHSGEITAVGEGTATVTVFSTQGYIASECTVTVTN
ncbi:MAG: Ig domain-containing protein [Clostridia bacterium]|nr:Ig domain-containing protein [Clostridia bacterium]